MAGRSNAPTGAAGSGEAALTDDGQAVAREVTVPNREGMHARPVMRFVDLASQFRSDVVVTNLSSGRDEEVDGKSAMHMMLLEATQGSVLSIRATGEDAESAVTALVQLVSDAFGMPQP